jgi:hypothetical protein
MGTVAALSTGSSHRFGWMVAVGRPVNREERSKRTAASSQKDKRNSRMHTTMESVISPSQLPSPVFLTTTMPQSTALISGIHKDSIITP